MYLHTARAVPGTHLLDDWTEARRLWDYLIAAAPRPVALCVLPTHVHLLHRQPRVDQMRTAMGVYARWQHHRRQHHAPVWQHMCDPVVVRGEPEQHRTERAIHLAPTSWVADPLAWPLSTYLDAVGLAAWPVRDQVRDPRSYHHQITNGPLPIPRHRQGAPMLNDVARAVSHLTRTPLTDLTSCGPSRTLLIRSASALTPASPAEIGIYVGLPTPSVQHIGSTRNRAVRSVEAALFDPRLRGLPPNDPVLAHVARAA